VNFLAYYLNWLYVHLSVYVSLMVVVYITYVIIFVICFLQTSQLIKMHRLPLTPIKDFDYCIIRMRVLNYIHKFVLTKCILW
jgi:hypothetical protein